MRIQDDYVAIMESQIMIWDDEIDRLSARGAQMNAAARETFAGHLNAMRTNRDAAYKRLQEMRTANEPAWQQMQDAVDRVWAAMKSAMTQTPAPLRIDAAPTTRRAPESGRVFAIRAGHRGRRAGHTHRRA